MGKSRRNRSGAAGRRLDPIHGSGSGAAGRALKAVKEPTDPVLAALRTAKILPVVRDLRSADPKTRTAAAGAVANIVEDARCRKQLLREQVVHLVLSETLADASVESRAAGWSVLSVLAQHEAPDFCVHLYRCDVLTPMAHALGQIRATLAAAGATAAGAPPPGGKLTMAQQAFLWRIAAAILDLAGHLVDARDEILQAVAANPEITRALFALAAGSSTSGGGGGVAVPFEIQWRAMATLARLCEEDGQRSVAEAIVDDQAGGGLYKALRRMHAAGGRPAVAASMLLHAVFAALEWFDHSPGRDGASDAILVPTLAQAIEQELARERGAAADGEDADDDRGQSAEMLAVALQTLATIGTVLKASLEKGNKDDEVWNGIQDDDDNGDREDDSAMFGPDSDDGSDGEGARKHKAKRHAANAAADDEDGMDIDGEEDGFGTDIDEDMDHVAGADDGRDGTPDDAAPGASLDDLQTLRAFVGDAIPQLIRLIAARAHDADRDSVAVLLDALSALNNIAWTVSLVDLKDAGNAAILAAWTPEAQRIWLRVVRPLLAQGLADRHVAAQATGLAWALARVLGGATPADAGEPARLMALRDAAAGGADDAADADGADDAADPFQSLGVKCIGVLGQMALDPAPAPRNREIGRYLLGVVDAAAAGTSAAAEAVEALNQLFDLYGDETAACDKAVFWHDGLLAAFEAALPKAKAIAKTVDKRRMPELRTRADEAILNLARFVQYKKKRAPRDGQ